MALLEKWLKDPAWRESAGWVTGGIVALQVMLDLKWTGMANNITSVILVITFCVVGGVNIRILDKLADRIYGPDAEDPEEDEDQEEDDEPAHGWPVIRRLD